MSIKVDRRDTGKAFAYQVGFVAGAVPVLPGVTRIRVDGDLFDVVDDQRPAPPRLRHVA